MLHRSSVLPAALLGQADIIKRGNRNNLGIIFLILSLKLIL